MDYTFLAGKRIGSFLHRSGFYFVFSKPHNKTNLSFHIAKAYSNFRGCVTTSSANEVDENSSFKSLLSKRIQQAYRSVVVEIPSQKAIFEASKFIEESGDIKEIVHCASKSKKEFIIAEFKDAGSVQNFLGRCKSVPRVGEVPTFSRIVKYVDTYNEQDSSETVIDSISGSKFSIRTSQEIEVKDQTCTSVSEVIENLYKEERLTDIELKLRFFVCSQVSDAFRGLFSHCEVLPFGSSVNGLGTHISDLDSVLIFYGKKEIEDSGLYFPVKQPFDAVYEQKIVRTVANVLNTFIADIVHVEPVYTARVPLVKFHHELFKLNCDLSTTNVHGLEMSELLYNCGLLDSRVRPLAFAIKKWAMPLKNTIKKSKGTAMVTSKIGTHTVSNFSLFLLLVFFLQNRPLPILPPLCQLNEIKSNEENFLMAINNLKSAFSNQETLGDLLKGFFSFLSGFDFKQNGISTYHGQIVKKDYSPLFIENPLDRNLNVSLNVSKYALRHLRHAACSAQNCLGALSKNSKINNCQFWKSLSSSSNQMEDL